MNWFRRTSAETILAEGDGEALGAGPGNVFEWSRGRNHFLVLSGFLAFSLLIHGAGFYLFRVAYPPPERVDPDTDRLVVLDPSEPAVRRLLQVAADRSLFLSPPSRDSGVRTSIEDGIVRFAPANEIATPEIFTAKFAWMPPPDISFADSRSDYEAVESAVMIELGVELDGREIAPWSILRDYLDGVENLPNLRADIVVGEDGLVSVESIEGPVGEGFPQALESTLRFLPAGEISSGWIEIFRKPINH